MIILLKKSHVSGYTRADGTVVAPHEDKRVAAKKKTTWYHGSNTRIEGKFSLDKFGSGAFTELRVGHSGFTPAIYLTDKSDHAAAYGDEIHHVELNERNSVKLNAKRELTEWAKENGHKSAQAMIDDYYDGKAYNAFDADARFELLAKEAKADGKKLAIIDFGDLKTKISDGVWAKLGRVAVVLDPSIADIKKSGELTKSHTPPTPAQAEAGKYKKPRVRWNGLEIAIENPVGSTRSGKGWSTTMRNAYGYICRSGGVDGDEVDVYLGDDMDAPTVYVVHQRKNGNWKAYDEDKCMIGFKSEAAARSAYLAHYDDDRFLGPITAMPVDEFVAKVRATYDKPAMIKAVIFFRRVALSS